MHRFYTGLKDGFIRCYRWLPVHAGEFLAFGIKQGWACLFGGAMLAAILATKLIWQTDWVLTRYDFLFLTAIALQACLLLFKLETWEEVKVIVIFHLVGTGMEIFKTAAGSWIYPEYNFFRLYGVPLFSGFMYSCVGSYLARVWRLFNFNFSFYPPLPLTGFLCAAIYVNFFSHHFIYDFRYILFVITALLYWRTMIYFTPFRKTYRMPLLLGFFLVSLFIWFAENIGTFAGAWAYPYQKVWRPVEFAKIGSWYLLMIISFVLVTFIHKPDRKNGEPANA